MIITKVKVFIIEFVRRKKQKLPTQIFSWLLTGYREIWYIARCKILDTIFCDSSESLIMYDWYIFLKQRAVFG